VYVSRIRQKIGDLPSASNYLKTVRGVGYQFVGVEN
jgi:DNA-binding response OmpR family regulator